MRFRRTGLAIVGLALLMGSTTACVGPRPEQQMVALQFEGGAFVKTARNFIKCVPGGTRGDHDFGGDTAFYPADQRIVDFAGGDGADRGPFIVKSKDGVDLEIPGTMQYYLNTECSGEGKEGAKSPIVQFDLNLGRRENASFDGDDPSKIPAGWRVVQKRYLETPLEALLGREALNYNWRDLVFDATKRTEWQNKTLGALPGLVNNNAPTEVEFWKNFQLLLQIPKVTGDAGAKAQEAIVNGQRLVAEAQAKEAQAKAEEAAARAQVAVARAVAEAKRQEVAAYGNIQEYNRAKCIEHGCNPYQPTYVFGGSGTAPAPQPSG